jgi:hypothetical protein
MRASLLVALSLSVALGLPACKPSPPAVDLSGTWPQPAPAYSATTSAWTRSASVRKSVTGGLDHVFSVQATAMSSEWRAAYVAEQRRRLSLSDEEVAELTTKHQDEAAKTWQFELLLTTDNRRWNDLGKWPRSMWRVALVTDDGRTILPETVKPDKRQEAEIASWFPGMAPYVKAYVVTFSKVGADGQPVVADGGKSLRLEFGGALGTAAMVWQAR